MTIEREVKQEIKSKPDIDSSSIEFVGDDCFHVKQMKGDWIEITTSGLCSEEELTNGKLDSGWIKWREKGRLLIKYYLTM